MTAADIRARFFTAWPMENGEFQSFNLLGNWQSRKVVDDYVAAFASDYPWERCDALFFDSFGGGRGQMLANAAYGGRGSYKDRAEGEIDMVRRVTEYARDPARTGRPKPLLIFTNIYEPKSEPRFKTVLLEYGSGRLRLDHYYYEAGGLRQAGAQRRGARHHGTGLRRSRKSTRGVAAGKQGRARRRLWVRQPSPGRLRSRAALPPAPRRLRDGGPQRGMVRLVRRGQRGSQGCRGTPGIHQRPATAARDSELG